MPKRNWLRRKDDRRKEAIERQVAYDKLTLTEKQERLALAPEAVVLDNPNHRKCVREKTKLFLLKEKADCRRVE